MNADELAAGDTFDLPTGSRLVVVGVAPASETPESARVGALYECEVRPSDGGVVGADVRTMLYMPHNIRNAIEAGAEHVGKIDVDGDSGPFWCEGCEYPHRAADRRDAPLTDADVCSYGCARDVQAERARRRIEEAAGR